MRPIDADALEELFREVIGGIAKKPEMNGNLEHMVRASAMVIEMIKDAPTIEERTEERTETHECDLISRQAAIDALKKCQTYLFDARDNELKIELQTAKAAIMHLPSAEAERKTGHWILHENQRQEDVDNGNYLYICSGCGKSDIHAKTQEVPFCWWCGAKMEVEHETD